MYVDVYICISVYMYIRHLDEMTAKVRCYIYMCMYRYTYRCVCMYVYGCIWIYLYTLDTLMS